MFGEGKAPHTTTTVTLTLTVVSRGKETFRRPDFKEKT